HKLVQVFSARGYDTFATIRGSFDEVERFGIFTREATLERVDVTQEPLVRAALESIKPDVVINAAGVIKQVSAASSVIPSLTINSIFPQRLGQLSAELGFRLITISTDCVFTGSRGNYCEADQPDAMDLYGISKRF